MRVTELDPFYLEGALAEEAYFTTRGGSDWVELAKVKEKMELALQTADVAILEVRGSFHNYSPGEDRPRKEDYGYQREKENGCYVAYRDEKVMGIIWGHLQAYEGVGIQNCVYVTASARRIVRLFHQ